MSALFFIVESGLSCMWYYVYTKQLVILVQPAPLGLTIRGLNNSERCTPNWSINIFKFICCDFAYLIGFYGNVLESQIYCCKANHSTDKLHTVRNYFLLYLVKYSPY